MSAKDMECTELLAMQQNGPTAAEKQFILRLAGLGCKKNQALCIDDMEEAVSDSLDKVTSEHR